MGEVTLCSLGNSLENQEFNIKCTELSSTEDLNINHVEHL